MAPRFHLSMQWVCATEVDLQNSKRRRGAIAWHVGLPHAQTMRIAICIPVHGETKAQFTASLARMLVTTLSSTTVTNGAVARLAIEIFTKSTSLLAFSRQTLLLEALGWRADYLLWLDADHSFPPDTLLRLLGHSRLVVGANYPARASPPRPTAGRVIGGQRVPVQTNAKIAAEQPLEQVDSMGLGLCLMSVAALEQVRKHPGREVISPVFQSSMIEEGPDRVNVVGEDVYFFDQLAAAGIPVYVDHALSMEVGHIGECVFAFTD